MKKIYFAALMSFLITAPAEAAGNSTTAGINIGANSMLGIHAEFDVSSRFSNAPVSAQVFFKNYSYNDTSLVTWNTTGIGVVGVYDFNTKYQLDKKIHPYAGIGLMYVAHKWTGIGSEPEYTGKASGLYVTGGVRLFLTPQVAADFNYNNFGTLTAGINFSI